ncbi:HNH endonuclease signature motif containing protein [Brevundimonas sp.]|uniref:HNH endonuclease signature motif containing protein n=1 Tax=Brevundimonas sp. TaxID=1871086 RepID=UPI0035B1744B
MGRSLQAREYRRLYSRNRKARAAFLARHPFCRFCESRGVTTDAEVVDHIQPHRGDEALFFDPDNWQALCAPCHDRFKAQVESRGWHDMTDWAGLPIDPNHPFNARW